MVSIITPVFNHAELTSKFIQSIAPDAINNGYELIIVDNNSKDNTLAMLGVIKKGYPGLDLTIISEPMNFGFGTANNIGVKLAKHENIVFCSNDVMIMGDFAKLLDDYLMSHPRDAVGPRLINRNTGWNTYDKIGTINYLEGFCFGVSRTNHTMIGGFDEQIFIDVEDIDYSFRLHLAGVNLAQLPLPVMHSLGGSFDGLSKSRLEFTLTSIHYFEGKWNTKLLPNE